jgi:hypothetical protein
MTLGGGKKPVPAGKIKLGCCHFSQANCILPERPERRLIEDIKFFWAWNGLCLCGEGG